jgi:HlyD family secretion protein
MSMNKRLLVIVVLFVAAGAAAYAYFVLRPEDDSKQVRVSGNIEVTDVEVSFRMAGWVEARPASEGQTIRKGELVARLDHTELAQQAALREAEVAAFEAELAALTAGSRPQEIAAAQAAVAQAEAELERARLEFERQKSLFERRVTSEQNFEVARSSYEAAAAKLQEAREQLDLVREGPRQEEITRARARLDQAKQSLAIARTRLGYATLEAPLSGMVLSENVESGEYVVPGVPVVTIGDLVHAWVRAYVNETDLGRVKPGQKVCVTTDTYPDKVYPGELTFISSEAEFTPKNVQTTEERVKLVYRIKIEIANPDLELKPGMPADAQIWLGEGTPPCLT